MRSRSRASQIWLRTVLLAVARDLQQRRLKPELSQDEQRPWLESDPGSSRRQLSGSLVDLVVDVRGVFLQCEGEQQTA